MEKRLFLNKLSSKKQENRSVEQIRLLLQRSHAVYSARIGAEFIRPYDSVDYKLISKERSFVGITIGCAIGGGKK